MQTRKILRANDNGVRYLGWGINGIGYGFYALTKKLNRLRKCEV